MPVGSLLLLEEDLNNVYSKFFMQCFLAEGATVGHEIMIASLDHNPAKLLRDLPAPVSGKVDEGVENVKDDMKIAWRYQNQGRVTSSTNQPTLGHHFDLKTIISSDVLDACEKFYWNGDSCSTDSIAPSKSLYRNLFKNIHTLLTQRKMFTHIPNDKPNIMRLGIFSLASFAWGEDLTQNLSDSNSTTWSELTTFFALLRSIVRQSYSVAFVSVPSHLFSDSALINRLSYHADYVIGLESFQGTDKEVHPLFKDYHGLLNIYKVSANNSLVPPRVDTKDWVFKLKRKRLCVEKLHLPPDLSETASRSQGDPVKNSASCGGGGLSNKLDF